MNMTTCQVKVIKRNEKSCDLCHRTVGVGESIYIRYGPSPATFCMDCYKARKEEWESKRDFTDRRERMTAFLREERTTAQLHSEFGNEYLKIIRRLILSGVPIRTRPERNGKNGTRTYFYWLDQRDPGYIDIHSKPNVARTVMLDMLREGLVPEMELVRIFGDDYAMVLEKLREGGAVITDLMVNNLAEEFSVICYRLMPNVIAENPSKEDRRKTAPGRERTWEIRTLDQFTGPFEEIA